MQDFTRSILSLVIVLYVREAQNYLSTTEVVQTQTSCLNEDVKLKENICNKNISRGMLLCFN